MPRVSDAYREARHEQILTAARREFTARGFDQTSMDDVIRAAGLSAGAVYRYFASKDDLVAATSQDALTRLAAMVAEVLAADRTRTIDQTVTAILDRLFRFATDSGGDFTRVAIYCWARALHDDPFRARIARHYTQIVDGLTETARAWQARGLVAPDADPRDVASLFLSTALGSVVQRHMMGGVEPARIGAAIAALRPPATPASP